MICCKLSYTWWLLLIPDNHHLAAVWLCTYVWFVCGFGSACAQLTDGTVCNELLCDNYGACWGKWKKKCWWVWDCVCLRVNEDESGKRVRPCAEGWIFHVSVFCVCADVSGVLGRCRCEDVGWEVKEEIEFLPCFFFLQNHCTFPASHCCYRHTVFFYRCCIWMRKKTGNITLGMALNVISCW